MKSITNWFINNHETRIRYLQKEEESKQVCSITRSTVNVKAIATYSTSRR